uniref:Variant surface glycoprotein 1125.1120 n=1 Tax=Trypanosoma brucei TaxID=5691 RepID=A0A1J0R6A1_9TRYP|nr:variant surface glycoprotein 1125.1120 [Trypanosoma brucei]
MFSAAILLLLTARFTTAANQAVSSDIWKPQCELTKELRKTAGITQKKLKDAHQTAKKLQETSKRLLTFALQAKSEESALAASALARTAAAEARAIYAEAQTTATKGLIATAYAAEMAGAIASTMHFLAHAKETSAYCLNKNTATGDGSSDVAAAGCGELDAESITDEADFDSQKIDNKGFKIHPALDYTTKPGEASKCGVFKAAAGSQTSNAGIRIGTESAKVSLAFGALSATTEEQITRKGLADFTGADASEANTFFGKAHAKLKNLRAATTANVGTATAQYLAYLKEKPEALTYLKLELAARSDAKKPSDFSSQDKELKTQYFGDNNDKMDALAQKVDAAKTLGVPDKLRELKNLRELTLTDQLEDALYFYLGTSHEANKALRDKITKLESNLAFQKGKSPESNCNKLESKEKCNEEKICSWYTEVKVGEKNCQFNSTKAKEKGVSVPEAQTANGGSKATFACTRKQQEECTKAP